MIEPLWTPPPPSPAIDRRHIHLWRVPLDREADELASLLAPEEAARRDRLLFPEARRRFTVTRGTLRRILGGYLSISPAAVRLVEEEGGKPYLAQRQLQFNISHSGELALIAVAAGRRVGIDLERERRIAGAPSIARRWFSAAECELLEQAPADERLRRFLEQWTAKEARLKAVGAGIWNLATSDLSGEWAVVPFAPAEGFIAALVVEGSPDWELEAFDVSPGRFQAESRR
ncbi:MAG TPA: 4'-phosphopantetheinyl transferase superfamily protein [Thermoanaerobaculia bacterium]|nr:4'-phosphopantetheinyl transferase superfamily protein [Thermoanaerobaculia bacterium]